VHRFLCALVVLAALASSTATARAQSEPTDVQHGVGFGCGLTSRGEVRCWGANDYGQLGRGGRDDDAHADAALVVGLPDATRALAVGSFHVCTAQTDGRVWCWGRGDDGQLGDGSAVPRGSPAVVPGVAGAVDVAAANEWTCALLGTGGVTCWGVNDYQQLAVRGLERRSTAGVVPRVRDAVELSVGPHHACVRHRNGDVSCWGGNEYGQSATGRRGAPAPPHRVAGVAHVAEIEVGETFSCARLEAGTVSCWGQNIFGSADPMAAVYARPTPMVGIADVLDLSAHSAEDICALVRGGAVWCTGVSRDGQIFRPDDASTMRPLPSLPGVGAAARVRVSGPVVCVWNQAGPPLCWGGSGASTALGTGARATSLVPAALRGF
jgi:alpha-tubulin suppressor-like RCC1 family protein